MRNPLLSIPALLLLAGTMSLAAQQVPQQRGPVIIPKTGAPATKPPAPPPLTPKQQAEQQKPQFNYSVNVPDVEIPVTVQTSDGQFVPNLPAKYFQLWENGVKQTIDKVTVTNDAPMTVVLLIEFRNTAWYQFLYDILNASYSFTSHLQKQDWVALVTYDLKPTIVVDFTHDPNAIRAGLNSLNIANFDEADEFDSLSDTIDRLDGIKGHKTIVLISTGFNTFSRMTWGNLQKKLKSTQNITIYTISMAWSLEQYLTGIGYQQQMTQMSILQGNNELRYIAKLTGGRYYEPRFQGEYNQMFSDIASAVRSQYVLSYRPTDQKLDGTERKVSVELIAPDGKKLKIINQKGKKVKYTLSYRETYKAKYVVQ